MRARTTFPAILIVLLTAIALYACGGGDSGNGSADATAVSAYVTDDPITGYENVTFTVNTVQLRHASGRSCEIIRGPLTVDFAEFGRDDLVDYVDTTTCEAGPYNRMYVELDDDVTLRDTDANPPVTRQCKFVSYYENNPTRPNTLACSNGICALEVTGGINLVARAHNHVALDAELEQFSIDTNVTPCEVTLKVSPLHADNKLAAGYRLRLSGLVSNLNTTEDRFVLSVKGIPYQVRYAGVTDQTGLDSLLQMAATNQLRTRVRCDDFDSSTAPPTCTPRTVAAQPLKAINVKAEGTVSALNTSLTTFLLNYGSSTLLPVNYYSGTVAGTLSDGVTAEVSLYGFDLDQYLAREVEVENGS